MKYPADIGGFAGRVRVLSAVSAAINPQNYIGRG